MILKFALRNLTKRPFLNLLKVVGLSLALSGILLIGLFLKNELTYDSFHANAKNIYRFTTTNPHFLSGKHFARTPNASYIPNMAEYFPEIGSYVRLVPIMGGAVKYKENYVKVEQAFQCDSTFYEVFDVELLVGNAEYVLENPGSMVISESFAKNVFGNINPMGQVLTLPSGQYYGIDSDFTIKGIMKDFPQNSHFHPQFITTPMDVNEFSGMAWSYLLLSGNANPGNIESGFKDFYALHTGRDANEIQIKAYLQNITDIHLHSNKLREIETNSNMTVIYTLSLAALLLLFIGLINYANLNIGMSVFHDKYLNVSKIVGSSRWVNLKYFISEGMVIVFATIVIGIFIASIANNIIQQYFMLNLFKGNLYLIVSFILLFGLLCILAGILPALKQIMHKIKTSISDNYRNNLQPKVISRSLIVAQFSVSIALIVAVIVIQRQTDFALKSSMVVETDSLICFENVHSDVQAKFGVFKDELLKYNSILSVSAMLEPPGGEANDMFPFIMEGYVQDDDQEHPDRIGVFPCDYSFASIFNLKFLSGRNFSEKNNDHEGAGEYIINEAAMKKLHYSNPDEITGKEFKLLFNNEFIQIPSGKIIGVVEDFHLSSLKKKVEPLVLFKREDLWLLNFVVAFNPGLQAQALSDIEGVWTKLFPEQPFQYNYVSSMYKNIYSSELLQARLLYAFTLIALFICSMGLLGMSLLTTSRRTKEIGIRKVNGAKINDVMTMLNRDYIKLIFISSLIAIPLAYLAMNKWLESFAYKITLSWWIFALAGLIAILVALLTVSAQSWKAASQNPVKALRYE